jgi:tryptophan synthase beta subunit
LKNKNGYIITQPYTHIYKQFLYCEFAAYERLCKLEGIYPSLEATHAFAILDKLVPTLPNDKSKVVVNCSGRGDKDAPIVFNRRVLHDRK